ncbi:MAG: gamma-glutamyl-gamma-aminobutyrate hydrolase family protein [Rhodospirillaceae bacterium]|nr:gamma-glutamyl-gamma-aminobutyrate hydrolase family protein [Rhodospirillaceae bacterium]
MDGRANRPWIAFSSRVVNAESYDEPRDALSQDWTHWATQHGALPLALPNNPSVALQMLDAVGPALLVLTGGNDAVQRADGGGDFDENRNRTELALIARALDGGVPILGVCRGMHMLNLFHGGTVCEDLGDLSDGHVAKTHRITLADPLRELSKADVAETNSFHRQGFSDEQVGAGLRVCARCDADGIVEAVAREDASVIGMGWHPERANPARQLDDAILSRLAPALNW